VNSSYKKLENNLEDDMEYMEIIRSKEDDIMSRWYWQEATKVTKF
jgi:hypothetical protein